MKPILSFTVGIAIAVPGAALAQGQPDFIGAAKIVAAQNDISVGEAIRRIKLQERILDLQAKLLKEDRGNFAGIAIVADSRRQRVKIKFKEPKGKSVDTLVADTELRTESEVEPAARSVDDLLAAQNDLLSRMKGYKSGGVAVGLNFENNGLNVKTKDVTAARAQIAAAGFDASIPLEFIAGDPTITDNSRVTGGRDVDGCQTGFVVANYSGLRGVSSAEHCGPGLVDMGTGESVGTRQAGMLNNAQGTDISWHRSTAHSYVNYIYTPNGEVRITSSKGISLMPYGTQACLSRTQYNSSLGSPAVSCGIVYNANYTFTDPSTGLTSGPWVAVSPQGSTVLSQPGDSGGPWFSGNAAMGIHKGKDPTGYSLFTPVERFSKISVLVATN